MTLDEARLYLVTPGRHDKWLLRDFLRSVLEGGVDVVQLRDRSLSPSALMRAAETFRKETLATGALFIVNDDPVAARECGADGVHVGQHDAPVSAARLLLGDGIVGQSTHSRAEILDSSVADYIGVGPVFATPTKPGRTPVGLDLVRFGAASASTPFFAIGGIDISNVREVIDAGGTRIAVARAIVDAENPGAAARTLRASLSEVH